MASYSSSVSYSNSYNSSSSFSSTVTGSSHSNTRYYHFAVTWWDGESDVTIYNTTGSLAGGVTAKTFTISNSYVQSGRTYTIHWMWGTSAGTNGLLDSLSDYSYYNTTSYTHSGGTTYYTVSASVSPSGAGSVSGTGSKASGSSYSVKATANTGYTFDYWGGDGNYSTANPITGTVRGNLNFIANFSAVYYAIAAYGSTGGSASMNKSSPVTYGTSVTFTATPNSGYEFSYWYTDDGYKYNQSFSKTITGDFEATAYFSKIPTYYNVSVSSGTGGTASATQTGSVEEGTYVTFTATPSSGYHFSYWTTTDGTKYSSSFGTNIYSNFTAIAYFEEDVKYYNVSVDWGAGGTASASKTGSVQEGTTVNFYSYPNTGYEFSFWSCTDGLKYDQNFSKSITSDYSAGAYFQAIPQYTITYKGNGGTPSRSSDTTYRDSSVYLPNATMPSESEVAYRYLITFDPNEGTVTPEYNYTRCDLVTSFSLDGWYSAISGGTYYGTYGSSYTVTADKTMYAHWNNSKSYTDSKLESLPTPTRTGYTFAGWWTSREGGTQVTTSTVFTSSSTIYAHWNVNTYAVTASSNNTAYGTVTGSGTYSYDQVATFTATPKSGYKRDYWYDSDDQYIYQDTYTRQIRDSYTTTAYFVEDPKTYYAALAFIANGGSGTMAAIDKNASTITGSATIPFTVPECTFTRQNYKFLNWNTNSSGSGTTYNPGDTINITTSSTEEANPHTEHLYAQWEFTGYIYELTLVTNDGSGRTFDTLTAVDKETTHVFTLPSTYPTHATSPVKLFEAWCEDPSGETGTQYKPLDQVTLYNTRSTVTLSALWTVDIDNPVISVVNATTDSLTMYCKVNSKSYARDVIFEIGSDEKTTTIPAGSQKSGNITFTGLTSGTTYIIYCTTKYEGTITGISNDTGYTNFNFTWNVSPSASGPIAITPSDWNAYLNQIALKATRHDDTFEYTEVSREDPIVAATINTIANKLYTWTGFYIATVSSGNPIAASTISKLGDGINYNDNKAK